MHADVMSFTICLSARSDDSEGPSHNLSPHLTPLSTSQSIFLLWTVGHGIPFGSHSPSRKRPPSGAAPLTRTPSSETSDALSQSASSCPPGFAQSCCQDSPPCLSGEHNSCVLGLGCWKENETHFHRQTISPSSPGGWASFFIISYQSERIRTQARLLEPKSIYSKRLWGGKKAPGFLSCGHENIVRTNWLEEQRGVMIHLKYLCQESPDSPPVSPSTDIYDS